MVSTGGVRTLYQPPFKYIEPHLSVDGQKLYFISTMQADSALDAQEDIWICEKKEGKWSAL
jgi:hypothetical protein